MIIVHILEYGVLALLITLSIWSVSIMVDRWRTFSREVSLKDLDPLRRSLMAGDEKAAIAWSEKHPGLHAGVIRTAVPYLNQGSGEAVDSIVRAFLLAERPKYEKGFPVLATLGSNAPFIGLFGTVLGIIRAFSALGENTGASASVMSGISLALVATATGLFVAIPAVVAFNTYSNHWKALLAQCDSLKEIMIAQAVVKPSTPRAN